MMGFRPEPSDITSSTIKISAIDLKALTEHSDEVDYQQHARAIMFKLMGGSLFPNTTGNKIEGCLILLQLWTWERLPMTKPRGVVPLEQLVNVPYGVRWVCYHRWLDCTKHSLRAYRDQLDRLLEGEFVWRPYPNVDTLPPCCSAGLRIWISRIPLIYGYVVEMYYPDRFCRQFGARQSVPLDVVQIGNPAHQPGTGYVPISPELQTALSCMADCHQRLDPGRHPDGFVPSHEVLRVHDLLGECIHALGHASILDHPQQQPVYNPGHIRRRADRRRDAPLVGVRRGGRGQRRLQVVYA
ncbi:unnamed protein product [Cuscuta campestris]|uniref:Aminotransferase-like plant mobile domain-containing protein n=1 Tax=Cuscuta campestris TaxID=132261 RepID=A0A484LVK1_9ASTE|nr:unnamed protein product [Cuscuta campestris]